MSPNARPGVDMFVVDLMPLGQKDDQQIYASFSSSKSLQCLTARVNFCA